LGDIYGFVNKATKSDYEAALASFNSKAALFEAHAPFKGPYFNGDKPALVDFAWGGFSTSIRLLGYGLGVDIIDSAKYPKLSGWIKAVSSIPSVQLAILLQLQDAQGGDTTNPASYANVDTTNAFETLKARLLPLFGKRFAQSYIWNNKGQVNA
jgi:glutathione S-transferase